MQVWALLRWWYGAGWLGELERQAKRLDRVEDYFSFGALLRSFFQPFKQIDAEPRRGDLGVMMRAWLDRTVSRVVGAAARLTLVLIGCLWWFVTVLIGVCWMLVWPFLPIAPLLGLVGMMAFAGVGL